MLELLFRFKDQVFDVKLALPFIAASIPAAFIGGYLQVDNTVYDILFLTLVFAAWKLFSMKDSNSSKCDSQNSTLRIAISVGFVIGFLSGIIGVGGGIFFLPIILYSVGGSVKTTAGISVFIC